MREMKQYEVWCKWTMSKTLIKDGLLHQFQYFQIVR